MKNGWADRLRIAVEEDGRSKRAISLAAGLGANYIEQTFNRGSAPTQNKLAAVLDELGQEAAIFVFTGVKANAETIEYLNLLSKAPKHLREAVAEMMSAVAQELQFHDAENPVSARDESDQAIARN